MNTLPEIADDMGQDASSNGPCCFIKKLFKFSKK